MREFPFQDWEKDVKDLVLRGERPSLDELEGYSKKVKDMLEEAWDTDPTKRPSAEDMVNTMTAVVKNYKPEKSGNSDEENGEESDSGDAAEKKSAQEDSVYPL